MNPLPPSRRVLLTGAAGGIGRATASALADRGYALGLIDSNEQPLRELAQTLGAAGAAVAAAAADVRDREAVGRAVEAMAQAAGPFGVVVACAGVGTIARGLELDTPGLRTTFEVNVLGVAHTIEATLPEMVKRGEGHVVGISSVAGF